MWCRCRCSCGGGVVLYALLQLLMMQQVVTDDQNDTAVDRGSAGNGTGDDGVPRVDEDGGRDARRVEPQRDQRCSVQPVQVADDGDSLLEATRTVDRYRVKPVVQAYYESPAVYRERPATALAYVRRRRPVAVMQERPQVLLLQPKPEDATATAVRYYYGGPATEGWDAALRPPWPTRISSPPNEDRRPVVGEPLVSLTADQVRRVLQRVYSEGVMAGEAAGPKFTKVRSSK